MSDASSLGSPAGRAPDSPLSLYGHQSGSPLLHSPQSVGAAPIHYPHRVQASDYFSPNNGMRELLTLSV